MLYTYLSSSFVEMLQGVLYTIFDKVLAPILKEILQIYVKYITRVLYALITERLLNLLIVVCSLVDFVESIFNVFAGITPVEVDNRSAYLLDAFFQLKPVAKAFLTVTAMAVGICMIFTIIKTAKSISDMALEDKNPVSHVLANGMKAGITFMLIPFLCISLLQLSAIITNQVSVAFESAQGGKTTVGTTIFLIAGLDADKKTTKASSPFSEEWEDVTSGRNPSFTDSVREPYLLGEKDYKKISQVCLDFYSGNFNFIVGFASAFLMLFVLSGAALLFIRRIFELLLLYIVSPLFVSTIPLDDGAMFSRWRELFVAKFFSGFGIIFTMKYYLMLIPLISGNELTLYKASLPGGVMINNILKILMIVGGAWAVYKSQHMIMQVMNPEAAMAEQQASAMLSGMIIGAATTAASAAGTVATGGASTALTGLSSVGKAASMAGDAASSVGKLAGAVGKAGSSDDGAFRG